MLLQLFVVECAGLRSSLIRISFVIQAFPGMAMNMIGILEKASIGYIYIYPIFCNLFGD
jgi:hypothetical protein